jgi:hypothetical protein
MSNTNETQTPVVEGVVVDENPQKKFCFTRKQIIAAAAAATTVAAGTAVVVYLRAKGTDPSELVHVAVDAVKETVENAN